MPNFVGREQTNKKDGVQAKKRQAESATKVKAYFLAALNMGISVREVDEMVALGFELHQHEEMLRHRAELAAKQKVEKAKRANPLASPAALKDKLEEAYLKAMASMSKKEVAAYKDCGIKITGSTLPTKSRPDINTATADRASASNINQVFKIEIEENGEKNIWFAKPFAKAAEQKLEWGEEAAGIELQSLNRSARSLATTALAAHMGWDVVSKSKMAVGTLDGRETPMLLSQAVKGKAAKDCDISAFDNEIVIATAVQMQIIDIITGQTDRHVNNFFIDMSGAKPSLVGIDHDQSFGPNITTAGGTSRVDNTGAKKPTADGEGLPYNGKEPPPVIDETMRNAINKLTHASITFLLGDNFTKAEIDAAKQRLASLKAWIASPECRVIKASEWGNADVRRVQTQFNSYTAHAKVKIPGIFEHEFTEQLRLFDGFDPPETVASWLAEYTTACKTSFADAKAIIAKATTKYPIMTDVIGLKKCVAIDKLFGLLRMSATARNAYLISAPSGRAGVIKGKCREALLAAATKIKSNLAGNTITDAEMYAVVDEALVAALSQEGDLSVINTQTWFEVNIRDPIRKHAPKPPPKAS